jgi:hypothetical protein
MMSGEGLVFALAVPAAPAVRWLSALIPAAAAVAAAILPAAPTLAAFFALWLAAEELQIVTDNLQFAPFLTAGFVVPGVELKAPFDEKRTAFPEVFASDFRDAPPQSHVHEKNLFPLLAGFCRVVAVDRHSDFAEWGALWRLFQFGIASAITHQHDFIEARHKNSDTRGNIEKVQVTGETGVLEAIIVGHFADRREVARQDDGLLFGRQFDFEDDEAGMGFEDVDL